MHNPFGKGQPAGHLGPETWTGYPIDKSQEGVLSELHNNALPRPHPSELPGNNSTFAPAPSEASRWLEHSKEACWAAY